MSNWVSLQQVDYCQNKQLDTSNSWNRICHVTMSDLCNFQMNCDFLFFIIAWLELYKRNQWDPLRLQVQLNNKIPYSLSSLLLLAASNTAKQIAASWGENKPEKILVTTEVIIEPPFSLDFQLFFFFFFLLTLAQCFPNGLYIYFFLPHSIKGSKIFFLT